MWTTLLRKLLFRLHTLLNGKLLSHSHCYLTLKFLTVDFSKCAVHEWYFTLLWNRQLFYFPLHPNIQPSYTEPSTIFWKSNHCPNVITGNYFMYIYIPKIVRLLAVSYGRSEMMSIQQKNSSAVQILPFNSVVKFTKKKFSFKKSHITTYISRSANFVIFEPPMEQLPKN